MTILAAPDDGRPSAIDREAVTVEVRHERSDGQRPNALLILLEFAAGAPSLGNPIARDRDFARFRRVDPESHPIIGNHFR